MAKLITDIENCHLEELEGHLVAINFEKAFDSLKQFSDYYFRTLWF